MTETLRMIWWCITEGLVFVGLWADLYCLSSFSKLQWRQALSVDSSSPRRTSLSTCVTFIDRITTPSIWTATTNNPVLTPRHWVCWQLCIRSMQPHTNSVTSCLSQSFWCSETRLLNLSLTLLMGSKCQVLWEHLSVTRWGVTVHSLLRWLQKTQKESLLSCDG